jgi:hypothetical protein
MSLSQGCHQVQSQRLSFRCSQRQELTQEQRLVQRQEQLGQYNRQCLDFIGFVSSGVGLPRIRPMATCINCYHELTVAEIVIGFKADVNDFTTQCPKCRKRFEATNLLDRRTGAETRFWCGEQTLERLPGLEKLEVEQIKEQHPHIYFSAIFHFGSLLHAFSKREIVYRCENLDWKARARFCLGQVPDSDVASIFGVNVREVTQTRKDYKIDPFKGKRSVIPANWKPFNN